MFCPRQGLFGTVEANSAKRPPEYAIRSLSQELGLGVEEIRAHAHKLTSLTGEEDSNAHRLSDYVRRSRVTQSRQSIGQHRQRRHHDE